MGRIVARVVVAQNFDDCYFFQFIASIALGYYPMSELLLVMHYPMDPSV